MGPFQQWPTGSGFEYFYGFVGGEANAFNFMHFEGVDDRDAAERLRGQEILVARGELPALEEGEWWAHELEGWQRIFLEQGKRGLRTKAEPEERELILARAKIGELMMRLELAEDLIEKRGFTDEWKRQRR